MRLAIRSSRALYIHAYTLWAGKRVFVRESYRMNYSHLQAPASFSNPAMLVPNPAVGLDMLYKAPASLDTGRSIHGSGYFYPLARDCQDRRGTGINPAGQMGRVAIWFLSRQTRASEVILVLQACMMVGESVRRGAKHFRQFWQRLCEVFWCF